MVFARQRIDNSNLTVQQVSGIDLKIRKLRWVRLGSVVHANFDPKSQPSSVKICSFPMLERKNLSDGDSSIASLVLFTARGSLELQRDEDALELIDEEENAENASSGVVGRTILDRAENNDIVGTDVDDAGDDDVIQLDAALYPSLVKSNLKINSQSLNSLLCEIILVSRNFPHQYDLQDAKL